MVSDYRGMYRALDCDEMKTLELTQAQIIEAIHEYAERRTAHGIVKTTEKS